MKFIRHELDGVVLIELDPRRDARGHFMRSYDEAAFRAQGLETAWLQDNESASPRRGTLRGLHFQRPPATETKLVRAVAGSIWDVFVDLRAGSPSYGHWGAVELSNRNARLLYLPRGFAHGFCTLTDDVVVAYKVDAAYAPEHEAGLRWNDPELAIAWPVAAPLISEKDLNAPLLRDLVPLDVARSRAA
jgi:dTDP-4-dehydrorhamnose 3,5-epimerase